MAYLCTSTERDANAIHCCSVCMSYFVREECYVISTSVMYTVYAAYCCHAVVCIDSALWNA